MNNDVFSKALALIPKIKEDLLRRVPYELQMEIGLNMNRTAAGDKTKNTTKILNVRKGNLFRSFTPNNPMNIFKKSANGIEYGSKVEYAAIHEFGGTIKHPGTNNGFGRKIPIPAHDIPIPQRPYLAPAIKTIENERLEQLVFQVFAPMRELFQQA